MKGCDGGYAPIALHGDKVGHRASRRQASCIKLKWNGHPLCKIRGRDVGLFSTVSIELERVITLCL